MKPKLVTYFALAGTIVFWGLSFIGTKIALTSFTPFVCVFLRLSLASVFFLVLLLRQGFPKIGAWEHKRLLLIALFHPGLYFTFETIGLTYTSASQASIIVSLVPVAVMLLARIFLKEKLSRTSQLGILLSIGGILILVMGAPDASISLGGSTLGDLLVLGAVITGALYTVLVRGLSASLSSLTITSFQIFYGTILFAPMFILQAGKMPWNRVSIQSIGAIVFLALFCTILGYLFYNYALKQIPATRAAVFLNGIPVVTAIGAWIILGERLNLLQGAGGLLVIAAVILANMPDRENNSTLPESV